MFIAIRTIMILSSIALFLPVFSGYVLAFTMLVCQLTPVWRRYSKQSDFESSPESQLVWMWRPPILILLGSYAVATVCAGVRDGGGNWHRVQQFLGNSTVKYGLLWFFVARFIALAVRDFKAVPLLARCLPWVTGLHLLYCLVQRYIGIDWVHGFSAVLPPNRFAYGVYRVSGFTSHPLTIGYQLCFIIAFCLAMVASTRFASQIRRDAGIAAIFAWLTILISGSRGPLLVSLILAGWAAIPFVQTRGRILIGAAAIAVVATILIFVIPGTIDRFLELLNSNSGDTRANDLHVYLQAFRDHPLVGLGHLDFHSAISAYYKQFGGDGTIGLAHNMYLQVAVESGLIGFCGFLQWIAAWEFFGRKLPVIRERWSFRGIFLVMILSGVTQNSLQDSSVMFTLTFVTIMLGACFSGPEIIRDKHEYESRREKYQNRESGTGQ